MLSGEPCLSPVLVLMTTKVIIFLSYAGSSALSAVSTSFRSSRELVFGPYDWVIVSQGLACHMRSSLVIIPTFWIVLAVFRPFERWTDFVTVLKITLTPARMIMLMLASSRQAGDTPQALLRLFEPTRIRGLCP